MRVLVACEFSGVVRDAFLTRGHDAVSCDLLPTEHPGPHHCGDVREILADGWDMMIAHPPCTYLAVSGARWWAQRRAEQADAIEFVRTLLAAPIKRVAIENPIGILSRVIGKPTQIIQPWQHGHGETKATCLWLRSLPALTPSNVVAGRRTLPGIALAMATQWGSI
jgi:site-specific DNA-cytosine methylase